MKYYELDTSGDYGDVFCYTDIPIDGFNMYVFYFGDGRAVTPHIKNGNFRLELTNDFEGTEKGAIIGNVESMLLCRKDFKDFLEEKMKAFSLESFRFDLINQQKELHSEDYFVVNPIGVFDCMNYDESEIDYMYDKSEGKDVVIGIDKYVLDKKKLENTPPLFRIKEEPQIYVVNENIAKEIEQQGFDNIDLIEFEVA